MDDMESRKFEDAFKGAFDDAKVEPSEAVWTNIELDLARAEGGEMKRRLLFYKLLAAASVTFAMCVAGVGYYVIKQNTDYTNAVLASKQSKSTDDKKGNVHDTSVQDEQTQTQTSLNSDVEVADSEVANQNKIVLNESTNATTSAVITKQATDQSSSSVAGNVNEKRSSEEFTSTPSNGILPAEDDNARKGLASSAYLSQSSLETSSSVQKLPRRVSSASIVTTPVELEPDPVALMMARLNLQEAEMIAKEKTDKKSNTSEKLWTSVGFSAGGFSAVNAGGTVASSSSMASMTVNRVAERQTKASGMAYSIGVSMGTRLSNRWVLQGGVNYMTQSSDYTANAVVTSDYEKFYTGSLNEIQSADGQFLNSAPYNVNNNVQFVSVPVQAGYLIIDKKFGIQMNAGVSTDLFLQNTLTPESEVLSKTTQGRGEDSPYRPLNFSGLLGSELSYRLGEHYRMAINPAIRYPFNSIYKSELGVKAMPLTFDVGLKFRYIFH